VIELSVEGDAVQPPRFSDDAQRVLELLGRAGAELSVVLCDDAFIRPLNAQWRDRDAATDVLSFPQDDPMLLGDVVISVQTAARQATELGHPLEAELRVLLVHGVLHLLGHDHHDDDGAQRMRAEEARLLAALGVTGGPGLVERASTQR
jgi:probable rRNA maturation factor